MKLNPVVTTISAERKICTKGLAERSEGLSANGHSTAALNTTWPTNRSQVTSATGTPSLTMRYLPVESSTAKQSVARAMSPIAFDLWRGSMVEAGTGRGVIEARFCINLCQNAIGG